MEQCEENSQENDDVIIEKEISKLIEEQRLFTERSEEHTSELQSHA